MIFSICLSRPGTLKNVVWFIPDAAFGKFMEEIRDFLPNVEKKDVIRHMFQSKHWKDFGWTSGVVEELSTPEGNVVMRFVIAQRIGWRKEHGNQGASESELLSDISSILLDRFGVCASLSLKGVKKEDWISSRSALPGALAELLNLDDADRDRGRLLSRATSIQGISLRRSA